MLDRCIGLLVAACALAACAPSTASVAENNVRHYCEGRATRYFDGKFSPSFVTSGPAHVEGNTAQVDIVAAWTNEEGARGRIGITCDMVRTEAGEWQQKYFSVYPA